MYMTLVIVSAMAAVVALAAMIGFKMVRHAETMVVERLGRYHRTLDSGINIVWPVFDRTRQINWRYMDAAPDGRPIVINRRTDRIDLRETVYDFPRQNVITRDNVAIASQCPGVLPGGGPDARRSTRSPTCPMPSRS